MRAHRVCSSDALFDDEMVKLKQIMINNRFTNLQFDEDLDKF